MLVVWWKACILFTASLRLSPRLCITGEASHQFNFSPHFLFCNSGLRLQPGPDWLEDAGDSCINHHNTNNFLGINASFNNVLIVLILQLSLATRHAFTLSMTMRTLRTDVQRSSLSDSGLTPRSPAASPSCAGRPGCSPSGSCRPSWAGSPPWRWRRPPPPPRSAGTSHWTATCWSPGWRRGCQPRGPEDSPPLSPPSPLSPSRCQWWRVQWRAARWSPCDRGSRWCSTSRRRNTSWRGRWHGSGTWPPRISSDPAHKVNSFCSRITQSSVSVMNCSQWTRCVNDPPSFQNKYSIKWPIYGYPPT